MLVLTFVIQVENSLHVHHTEAGSELHIFTKVILILWGFFWGFF